MKKFLLGTFFICTFFQVANAAVTISSDCSALDATAKNSEAKLDTRYQAAVQYKLCLTQELAGDSSKMFALKSNPLVEGADDQVEALYGSKKFMDQNFGVGFAISFYNKLIVDDADIINGIVVAKSKKDKEARVILEFHTLIACTKEGEKTNFGCGPFAALATTQANLLGGVGLGWLWSWKNEADTDGSGFSLGLGAIVDNSVKTLADGFTVGYAPPAGETVVRYITEPRISYLLFMSNNF